MKVRLLNSCAQRAPQLSYNQSLKDSWPELKKAIEYSSKAFYQIIIDKDYEDLHTLDSMAQYTIWKYFNRAKYRPTPFGYFGSCSTAELNFCEKNSQILIKAEPDITSFINWPYKEHLQFTDAQYFSDERSYKCSESIYYTSDSIRYIFRNKKLFELTSIDRNEFIESVLTFCKGDVSYACLHNYLEQTGGLSLTEISDLLTGLLQHQLLYTDLTPNIIGPDYFMRMGVESPDNRQPYIIAHRKVIEGTISADNFRNFNDCLASLLFSNQEVETSNLDLFKRNFLRRFEDQEISIMVALDPELGIGYGNLAQVDEADEIDDLIPSPKANPVQKITWGKLETYLLQKMIEARNDPNHIIQLEDFKANVDQVQAMPLPNTFSALVNVIDDWVIIESLGGCTATALLGRFTNSDPQVKNMCKQLVSIEADANPDVIFFDIGYLSEDQVDNINRRDAVYDYELPILVYSLSANPVHLYDIFVSVRNDEVILYSKQYKKRLIPRLASAYNYHRSDLSLYRFLCDLQHQGITSQLKFDLKDKIPGAKFYPRVEYRNIVLSPAKWIINLAHYKNSNHKNMLQNTGVKSWFKVRNNDLTLTFNLDSDEDMISFEQYAKQQKQDFYVEEAFMPKSPIIKDEQQMPYLPQVVLSFYHRSLIYKGVEERSSGMTTQMKCSLANILPGNDWLYFEVYCNPCSSDKLITGTFGPLINSLHENIATWFFIRYLAPEHHLRLRLQIKPGTDSYAILNTFSEAMKSAFDDGLITDIQIKPYKREIERYGLDLIEQIEKHFCVDSVFVLEVLDQEYQSSQIYQLAVSIGLGVIQRLQLEKSKQLLMVQYYLDSFILEHKWEFKDFKRLNKKYASFQKFKTEAAVSQNTIEKQTDLTLSFNNILGKCLGQRQTKLYGDLFHMLINRLFAEHQRIHEGVVYYFMVKELQREVRSVK